MRGQFYLEEIEMTATNRMRSGIRAVALTAMLAAVSAILQFLEFPMPFLIPSFVKIDF